MLRTSVCTSIFAHLFCFYAVPYILWLGSCQYHFVFTLNAFDNTLSALKNWMDYLSAFHCNQHSKFFIFLSAYLREKQNTENEKWNEPLNLSHCLHHQFYVGQVKELKASKKFNQKQNWRKNRLINTIRNTVLRNTLLSKLRNTLRNTIILL